MSYERLSPEHADELARAIDARVRSVPDFPQPGILFRDISTVLADATTLRAALRLHVDRIGDLVGRVDKVVGVESRGFLFGMALAVEIGAGFVLIRKPGKLPAETIEVRYELEYGSDRLQIHTDAIDPGEKVVLIDDLLATGGTAGAAKLLIERLGGELEAAVFLIELEALKGREKLSGVRVETVLRY